MIRFMQTHNIDLLISKLSFQRVIHEVYHELIKVNLRFQSKAIKTLQKTMKA